MVKLTQLCYCSLLFITLIFIVIGQTANVNHTTSQRELGLGKLVVTSCCLIVDDGAHTGWQYKYCFSTLQQRV